MRKAEKLMTNFPPIDGLNLFLPGLRLFLSNLLSFTQAEVVPFKPKPLSPLGFNFHVNKCSQVGVAMAISPQLPWRQDRGGTESGFLP